MISKEKRDYLFNELGFECVVFDNPSFDDSLVGVTPDGHAIYDFDSMVEELSQEENMSEEEAIDFISYNTLRALPYIDEETRPIIMYGVEV